jgi:hypothetical protein
MQVVKKDIVHKEKDMSDSLFSKAGKRARRQWVEIFQKKK